MYAHELFVLPCRSQDPWHSEQAQTNIKGRSCGGLSGAPMGSVNALSGEHEHKPVTRSIDLSKKCPLYFAGKPESDDEELLTSVEKKRRLNVDQVNYLEANFTMDSKLEPERKAVLAKYLGIRPRQVAIWFQNRRARWKTQQLEQDYENLKTNYESETKEKNRLLNEYDLAKEANKRLRVEVARLTSSLQGFERSGTVEAEEEQPSSGKSEVFSTSKSGNDPNEVQDSGQSCRTLPETVMFVRPSLHIEQSRSACLGECELEEPDVPSSDCNVVGLPTWAQHVIAKGYSPDSAYNALYEWEKHLAGPTWCSP